MNIKKMSDEDFYNKYKAIVYKICKEYRRQPYYEDLVQECLIKMFEIRDRYSDNYSLFSTYLYKCLLNQISRTRANIENTIRIPEYRKGEGRYTMIPARLRDRQGEWVDYYDTITTKELDKNWKYNLSVAKKHITDKKWFRNIQLRLEGYTYSEIARMRGVSPSWIKEELRRASVGLQGRWCDVYNR